MWGADSIISPGAAAVWTAAGLAAALAAWTAAVLTARWTRFRAGRRVERRIGDVYELIRVKAEAARDADYAHPPLEAFALYHTLREELFELALVGGAVQALKDAVSQVAAASPPAPPFLGIGPVKGATVVASQVPTALAVAVDPRPNEALRAAVLEFWIYWTNRARVEAHLRGALRNLGADWVRAPRARHARPKARIGLAFRWSETRSRSRYDTLR